MHILKLFKAGEDIDLSVYISNKEVDLIRQAKEELGTKAGLKAFYEYFEESMSYDTIKYGLMILEREV